MKHSAHINAAALLYLLLFGAIIFSACTGRGEPVIPKPRGFHRMVFPEKSYTSFTNGCPVVFEIPEYAHMEHDLRPDAMPCWMDMVFPDYNARLHLSYFPIWDRSTLKALLDDAHRYAFSHSVQASAIDRIKIERPEASVHGLWYHIKGHVASSFQFYVTDSSRHYLRGALYFNEPPKIDSLQPVLDFLRTDVEHMVETIQWK